VTRLLVAVAVLAFPYIALEVVLPLPGWVLNVPVADLAALVALPIVLLWVRPLAPRPGIVGYALLVAAFAFALRNAIDPKASLHFLARKPVFLYLAYGVGVATIVARAPGTAWLRRALLASVAVASAVLIASSVSRIAAGLGTWYASIAGLTNNHKTLAVAIAPTLPLLWRFRRGRVDDAVLALAVAALALSMSRTSWIAAAAGMAYVVPLRGRPLADRRGLVAGVVALGALLAVFGPVLARSPTQLDAARSRHSLDVRAWEMFTAHPLVGYGGGTNVQWEMQTYPHYRVNGVDAHGVVQKVASEAGLVGLAGFVLFVGAMALVVRGRTDAALWGAFVALHVNLLFSTETFSQTHWLPLGLIWGLANRASGFGLRASGTWGGREA
jgi:hypothetical protein